MLSLTNAIGGTLRDIRKDKHLTLRQVSKKANIALGHLSDVERGAKTASNEMLEAIARGLDITTVRLIEEVYLYLKESNEQS